MNPRARNRFGSLAVVATSCGLGLLASMVALATPAFAESGPASKAQPAAAGKVPRLSDGRPDFNGTWDNGNGYDFIKPQKGDGWLRLHQRLQTCAGCRAVRASRLRPAGSTEVQTRVRRESEGSRKTPGRDRSGDPLQESGPAAHRPARQDRAAAGRDGVSLRRCVRQLLAHHPH